LVYLFADDAALRAGDFRGADGGAVFFRVLAVFAVLHWRNRIAVDLVGGWRAADEAGAGVHADFLVGTVAGVVGFSGAVVERVEFGVDGTAGFSAVGRVVAPVVRFVPVDVSGGFAGGVVGVGGVLVGDAIEAGAGFAVNLDAMTFRRCRFDCELSIARNRAVCAWPAPHCVSTQGYRHGVTGSGGMEARVFSRRSRVLCWMHHSRM
jgi:hypothetical protein